MLSVKGEFVYQFIVLFLIEGGILGIHLIMSSISTKRHWSSCSWFTRWNCVVVVFSSDPFPDSGCSLTGGGLGPLLLFGVGPPPPVGVALSMSSTSVDLCSLWCLLTMFSIGVFNVSNAIRFTCVWNRACWNMGSKGILAVRCSTRPCNSRFSIYMTEFFASNWRIHSAIWLVSGI